MTNKQITSSAKKENRLTTSPQGASFEIHVRGQLDDSWSDWLEGLQVTLLENGEMILTGYLIDQAALMGTLNKLYGLNLTLLSLSKVDPTK